MHDKKNPKNKKETYGAWDSSEGRNDVYKSTADAKYTIGIQLWKSIADDRNYYIWNTMEKYMTNCMNQNETSKNISRWWKLHRRYTDDKNYDEMNTVEGNYKERLQIKETMKNRITRGIYD